jgi:branched-chain amino acid aminotransferase
MMAMSIHRYVLHNGRIREASEAGLFPGQLGLLAGWGVFSTLRVMDGTVFAWERHWERMSRDARLLNVAMPPDADAVERDLIRLVDSNSAPDCTLRLVVVRNGGGLWEGPAGGRASDVIALTAGLKKWGSSVRLGVQPNARHAASDFARAKMLSWAPNLRWFERAQEQGLDEVILLNEFGNVAECTSANIFAAIGDRVFTPPLTDGCLPGITREILLEGVHGAGIEVTERSLTVEELEEADEVFITSTTRNLLKVREIAGRSLDGGDKVRERLARAFETHLKNDIARRKRTPAAV